MTGQIIFWIGVAVSVISLIVSFALPSKTLRVRLLVLALGLLGITLTAWRYHAEQEKNKPRTLTSTQQERISSKIRQFAGVHFDFGSNGESESLGLLDLIEETLKQAMWDEINWSGTQTITRSGGREVGIIYDSGVVVGVEQQQQAELLPAAKALASALSSEGIKSEAKFTGGVIPNTNHNAIHVMVGSKP